jgi:Flp pilus assembly protein TadG
VRRMLIDRRGSVALMAGMMAPVMVMGMAMGIEVTSWSVMNLKLQQIADVAAWAGARQYIAASNAQSATQTAANVAEVNGVSGTTAQTWSATTSTTTDNMITAQVVSGIHVSTDTAVKVTVSQVISKTFSRIFPSAQTSVTISATAIAEIVSSGGASPQPCLVALQAAGSGITLDGSAAITSSNCSLRSNAGVTLNGNPNINVNGTYANGAITLPGTWDTTAITGGSYANSTAIVDPYASDTALQSALSSLPLSVGIIADPNTSYGSKTLSPGTYSSLTLGGSSNITMSAGTYFVNGNVTFSGAVTVNGTGVTIIFAGALTDTASAAVSLTPPTSGAVLGIPGILFAGNSTAGSSFSGAAAVPLTGVIYYPNGNISFSGSASATTAGCSEIIGGSLTFSGASTLSASGCTAFGTVPFGSLPSSTSVALVE